VTLLQKMLGAEHYTVLNAGNSSRTMSRSGKCGKFAKRSMHHICSYWDTPNWKQALGSTPDVVTIMLGTNDAKSFNWYPKGKTKNTFTEDFKLMLLRLAHLTPPPRHVIVLTPPPAMLPLARDNFSIDPSVLDHILPSLLHQIVSNSTSTFTSLHHTLNRDGRSGELKQKQEQLVSLLDVHSLFTTPSSPAGRSMRGDLVCPLDGVHLTPAGNELIASALHVLVKQFYSDMLL
jgi:lysophospholipase L1-like esterase